MAKKVFFIGKPFILGKCNCGYCNEDINIRGSEGYLRRFKLGHNAKGVNNPRYKGNKLNYDDREMFNMPWHPNADKHGYVYKYVLYMSQKLGRPLNKGEVVHHIDGNIKNNDLSNLQLLESQARHISITMKKDMNGRRCCDPLCPHPEVTDIDKNGHERWYGNDIEGFRCRTCYARLQYHKNKLKKKD